MRIRLFYTLLMATGFSFSMEAMANDRMEIDDGAKPSHSSHKRPCPTKPTQSSKKIKFSEEVQEKNKVLGFASALNIDEWQNILSFIDDFNNLAQLTQGTYHLVPALEKLDILKIPAKHKQAFFIKLSLLAAAEMFNEDRGWNLPFNPLLTFQHNNAVTYIIQKFKNLDSVPPSIINQLIPQTSESDHFELKQAVNITLKGLEAQAMAGNKKSSEFISWVSRYAGEIPPKNPPLVHALNAIHKITQAKRYKLTLPVKQGFEHILKNLSETELEAYFKKEATTQPEKLTLLDQQQTLTFPVGFLITYLWKDRHPTNPLSDKLLIEMIRLSHPLSPFHKMQSQNIYSALKGKALSTENAQLLKEFKPIFEGNASYYSADYPLTPHTSSIDEIFMNELTTEREEKTNQEERATPLSPRRDILERIDAWLKKENITPEDLQEGLEVPIPKNIAVSFNDIFK